MNFTPLITKLIEKKDLTAGQMREVMLTIMQGKAHDIEIAAFLVALQSKTESIIELNSAVKVMRSLATPLAMSQRPLIDIVGTGGDKLNTFNVSTAATFVVAQAGGAVAKHGNRASSSHCGSADVLEQAGCNLECSFETLTKAIENLGVGFLFAKRHHSAMSKVAHVRKVLGIKTIFNLLGPLTNPAGACYHLMGVYHKKWLEPFAKVLKAQGAKKALIVHGEDGLDEITLNGKTFITELSNGHITSYDIHPNQFGIQTSSLESIKVNNPQESLAMIKSVFSGEPSKALDIVALNAGAALYCGELVDSIAAGVQKSLEVLKSQAVARLFERYIQITNQGF